MFSAILLEIDFFTASQIQPVGPRRRVHEISLLLYVFAHLVSEAGSEQSTNFRWWNSDSMIVLLFVGWI